LDVLDVLELKEPLTPTLLLIKVVSQRISSRFSSMLSKSFLLNFKKSLTLVVEEEVAVEEEGVVVVTEVEEEEVRFKTLLFLELVRFR